MEDLTTRGAGPILPILEGAAEREQVRTVPEEMAAEDVQAFVNFTVLVYRGVGVLESSSVRREAIPGKRCVVDMNCLIFHSFRELWSLPRAQDQS